MQLTFHEFSMGDVDDVDIYVAQPLYEWQQTEQGKWVMQHARDLKYYTSPNFNTLGHKITVRGRLPDGPLLTEYLLKFKK